MPDKVESMARKLDAYLKVGAGLEQSMKPGRKNLKLG